MSKQNPVILKYYTIKKLSSEENFEIVNSRQHFSHVFLYTRVVLKPAK
jgi:hypothetical protein